MIIKNVPIEGLIHYDKNAKRHDQSQIEKVARSINEFGWAQPVVVSKDNVIIIGHGRVLAAKHLGLTEAPVVVMDNLSDDQVKALRIADNKLNESEWDMTLVMEELKLLPTDMVDLTGFDQDDIQAKISADEIGALAKENDIDLGKYKVLTVEAPEAPRLKARKSFYCDTEDQFNRLTSFFKKSSSELDTNKLISLLPIE